jgi:ABC-2 type transport system permease protein
MLDTVSAQENKVLWQLLNIALPLLLLSGFGLLFNWWRRRRFGAV